MVSAVLSMAVRLQRRWLQRDRKKSRLVSGPMLASFEYVLFNDHDAMKAAIDENTAAVMIEIVQGEGGIHVVQQSYLDAIQTKCQEQRSSPFIIDEIQTGIRTYRKAICIPAFQYPAGHHHFGEKGLGNGPANREAMIGKEELSVFF